MTEKNTMYPELQWWSQSKDLPQIDFINGTLFRKDKLLESLGINNHSLVDSFGITDHEELKRRSDLVRFLIANPEIRVFFKKFPDIKTLFSMPIGSGKDFLIFYYHKQKVKRMPFYKCMLELQELLNNASEHYSESQRLRDFLNEHLLRIRDNEVLTARNMKKIVDQATFLEGDVTLKINYSHPSYPIGRMKGRMAEYYSQFISVNYCSREDETPYEEKGFGFKKHYYGLANQVLKQKPGWIEKNFWKGWIGSLVNAWIDRINDNRIKLYYSDHIYEYLPSYIKKDIYAHVKTLIPRDNLHKIRSLFQFFKNEDAIYLRFFFRYNHSGLFLKLVNLQPKLMYNHYIGTTKPLFSNEQLNFIGYTTKTILKLREENQDFAEIMNERIVDRFTAHAMEKFATIMPGLNEEQIIKSSITDKSIKWIDLYNLYQHPRFIDAFKEMDEIRDYMREQVITLQAVSLLVDKLVKKSEEWKLPLSASSPESQSANIISFEELYPIQIIGDTGSNGHPIKAEDLKPIRSLPKINGQIIGLTGQNAGGKSVAHETIVNNLYLAQSVGLVFGKSFRFNPKKLVGLLFLDRGDGSTMQLQARGLTNIFKALEDHENNSVFLVLDEIGTGTDYHDAVDYGMDLLFTMKQKNVSCIYTTQFSDIAVAAEKIGAMNFKIDHKHQITPGIGKPNLQRVLKQEGLTRYLKKYSN